jgi:hypothetical protein
MLVRAFPGNFTSASRPARADRGHVKTWRTRWQQEGCRRFAVRSFHPVKPVGVGIY